MSEHNDNHQSGPEYIARRDFLARAGGGIGGLALALLLGEDGALADTNPHTQPAKTQNRTIRLRPKSRTFHPK